MGRGLSTEQEQILDQLVNHAKMWGTKMVRGCKLTICHPKWEHQHSEMPSAEELRAYNVAAASQSRTLRRLIKRGLIEKHRIAHWNSVFNYMAYNTIYSAAPQAELMAKSWRTEFNL
jgi:hypothetical protein